MKRIIILLVLVSFHCGAQDKTDTGQKISFSGFTSIGRSIFMSNVNSPKFPTLELRLGGGVSMPIGNILELKSRLVVGAKLKRNSYGGYMGGGYLTLEEVANRNHYFLEIPLLLQVNVPHPRIGISAGLNYRKFFYNKETDFLDGRGEVGILVGACIPLGKRLTLGAEYYFGLTKMYKALIITDKEEIDLTSRNEFAQLTLQYRFKKRI